MFSFRKFGLVVAGSVAIAGSAQALTVQVSQESAAGLGDFGANILGLVTTYDTALTNAGFYQYDNPNFASYNGELNGGPLGIDGLSQAFLVNGSDGLIFGGRARQRP